MDKKDLLPILFERSNATATLWNIEIVGVLGLIAFLASAGPMTSYRKTKLALLTVGFLAMASFNLVALIEVVEQRRELVDFFRKLPPTPLVFATTPAWGDQLCVVPGRLVAILNAISLGGCDPLYVAPVHIVVIVQIVFALCVVAFLWIYSPPPRLLHLIRHDPIDNLSGH